ncbi:MAG: D-ribose-binding periplasmic protein [Acidimicrobiaceae bacterium]|nr:D-ribose-binding periplasmic protein [Acidimicrobiaceae bacterium]
MKHSFQRAGAAAVAVGVAASMGISSGVSGASAGHVSRASGKLTIALVVGASSDPFFQAMKIGAQQEASKLGVNVIYQGNSTTYSPATQIPVVNQVLATKPSGLAIAPTDPTALQAAVNRAISEGIPVVNVDTHVNSMSKVLSFITGNNTQGGMVAADALAKAMHYKSGSTFQVAVGLSSGTSTTDVARLTGFKQEIAKKYPGVKIVATGYSESNSATANTNINNWLTAYPHLTGIFAIDGTNATGASSAIQAKGLVNKVSLVGYDAYANNVSLIKKGVITALIAQQPTLEGKMAVDDLVHYLRTHNTTGIQKAVQLPNITLTKTTPASTLKKYTYPA